MRRVGLDIEGMARMVETAPTRPFPLPEADRVRYGVGAFDSIGPLVDAVGGRRVFAVLSGSLAGSAVEGQLRSGLGPRLAGTFTRTGQHVPTGSVLAATAAAREARADCLLSVGGGSPIDCAKAVALCLAADVTSAGGLAAHRMRFSYPAIHRTPEPTGEPVPHIAVPTTLSGGAHTSITGVTDESTRAKHIYTAPGLMPRVVVLDPRVTTGTPGWLWAATGMRAVDHAVEGMVSDRATPFTDALAVEALRLVAADLAHSAGRPDDLGARMNCLSASWLATHVLISAGGGLSHGIGHQLGARFDLPHGHTSSIMLPTAMEFVAGVAGPALRRVAGAMGVDTSELADPAASCAAIEAVRGLITRLGLPASLRAAGAVAEQLSEVAAHALCDPALAACPRRITREQMDGLLLAAW